MVLGNLLGFPGGSEVKASACNVEDLGSIPGLGRSPGEGNGNPLQYSCLVNPMDGGAWWATVHGVAKSRTRLSDFTFTFIDSDVLFCFLHSLFSSYFSRGNFYWPLSNSFLFGNFLYSDVPIKSVLHFCHFFSPSIFFFLILEFISLCLSITLFTFPICFCMLLAFYFGVLNILIVMLNFLYYNSYSFAVSVSF